MTAPGRVPEDEEHAVLRRILLATAMVAATTAMAIPAATAGPTPNPQCPTGGVKVSAAYSPATVSVTDTSVSSPVDVVVTITGAAFTISAPAEATYLLTDATWCLKSGTKSAPTSGTGLTGSSPSTNKKGVAQDLGYVVVYSVTTSAVLACHDAILENYSDVAITGPLNTYQNAAGYNSTDGTCSGPILGYETVVTAGDSIDALTACLGLESATRAAVQMNLVWPTVPSNYYGCARSAPE